MTEERRRFRRKKQALTLAHMFFVLIAVFGISAMYLNSNYGKGIKWVFEEAYEDSPQFTSQLSNDIGRIFTYVGSSSFLLSQRMRIRYWDLTSVRTIILPNRLTPWNWWPGSSPSCAAIPSWAI